MEIGANHIKKSEDEVQTIFLGCSGFSSKLNQSNELHLLNSFFPPFAKEN